MVWVTPVVPTQPTFTTPGKLQYQLNYMYCILMISVYFKFC